MIAPTFYPMGMWQGTTWDYEFTLKQNGSPINLDGYETRLTVRTYKRSPRKVLDLTEGHGIVTGSTDGKVVLYLEETVTKTVTAGEYVYDLEIVSDDGKVYRILEGPFTIYSEATR